MEFRILGPLEVEHDGRSVPLGSGRRRALVAALLLHRNEVVSVDRLVDELWDGDPPQLWEAAQRLLDLGHDRHDVLHVLIEIAERIGDHPDELADAFDDIADIPDSPPL